MNTTLIVVITVIVFIGTYLYYNFRKIRNTPDVENSPMIKVLTDKNFQHQIKNGILLVDFWASWCMPCKLMAPVINEVAEEISGNANVGKLDVELYKSIAAKYNIRNIPTMLLFRNGKEINRYVGAKSKSFLLKEINMAKNGR
jgi:thioredoxin 1